MKVKKLFCCFLIVAISMLSIAGCAPESNLSENGGTETEYVIKISSVLAESHPNCQGLYAFEKYLEEKSDGRIDVQVYPGGILATSDEINVELVMTGGTEMAVSPAYVLAQKANLPQFDASIFPFLLEQPDKQVYYEFFNNSDVWGDLTKEFEKQSNIMITGYYDIGWIDIGNKVRPFVDVDSGKGLKIRSAVAPIWKDTLENLGPSAVPMAYGEVFAALQQGTIDGVVSSTPCFVSDLFYEELNYITLSHHVLVMYGVYINKDFYNNLSDDLKPILLEACEYMIEAQYELENEFEQKAIDTMKDAGLEVHILTESERAEWIANAKKAIDKNVDAIGRDFYNQVTSEFSRISKGLKK